MNLKPSRPEGCLSDFTFDLRATGELDAPSEERARQHLETCERCTRRAAEIEAERKAFAHEAPPLAPALRVANRRRTRVRGLITASGLVAAAAGVLLFAASPGDQELGTRSKGERVHVGFFVSHAGVVRKGGDHERVEPGDGLRFVVTARDARYVALLSVDAARQVSLYFPVGSSAAYLVSPGVDVPLPASTVLDDTLGDETIYGVLCKAPFDAEPMLRALEAAPSGAPSAPSCDVVARTLVKEAPGRK